MSNILWKNLNTCLPKFKCLSTTLPPPSPTQREEDHSLPISSSALIKNFNSLYDLTSAASTSKSLASSSSDDLFSSSDHDSDTDSLPDFATIFASQRFFFSSPGRSNSIVDLPEPDTPAVNGGVPILTYSPDPYSDFRRSMQEMVEAHQLKDVEADWDYLHELLVCYLTLNPKHTHQFIISAFADLIVFLMPKTTTTTTTHSRRRPKIHRRSPAVARQLP